MEMGTGACEQLGEAGVESRESHPAIFCRMETIYHHIPSVRDSGERDYEFHLLNY